jgi:hypothetical protein
MHSVGQGNVDRINLRVCDKLLIGSVCLLDLVRFGSLLCVAHIARCNGLDDGIGMGFDGVDQSCRIDHGRREDSEPDRVTALWAFLDARSGFQPLLQKGGNLTAIRILAIADKGNGRRAHLKHHSHLDQVHARSLDVCY